MPNADEERKDGFSGILSGEKRLTASRNVGERDRPSFHTTTRTTWTWIPWFVLVVLVETAKVYRPQNLLRPHQRLLGGATLSTCSLVQPAPRNKQSRTRPRACFPLRPVVPKDAASAHVVASAETDPAFPSGNHETTSGSQMGALRRSHRTYLENEERGCLLLPCSIQKGHTSFLPRRVKQL